MGEFRFWVTRIAAPVVGLLMLVACTEDQVRLAEPSGADPSATGAASSSRATPPPPAPTAIPDVSSGPLSAQALPAASDLGSGWRTRVEGADEEEGVGNGTAYQSRDPREIVETTIPMGCQRRSPSPVPSNVLQSTYRHAKSSSYAVALRMRFESAADAAQFAEIRAEDLQACRDQPDDPFSGAPAPVLEVAGPPDRQVVRYRLVGEEAVWVSALQLRGRDVLTLDTDARPISRMDWDALGYQEP